MLEYDEELLSLAKERIREIRDESDTGEGTSLDEASLDYFFAITNLAVGTFKVLDRAGTEEEKKATLADLAGEEALLYGGFKTGTYAESFLSPAFAVKRLGREKGGILSAFFMDFLTIIPYAYAGLKGPFTLYLDLLIEIHGFMEDAAKEGLGEEKIFSGIQARMRSFMHDNCPILIGERLRELIDPEAEMDKRLLSLLMDPDLSDPRFLYLYGLPVGENELGLWEYINTLSGDEVSSMARTLVHGFVSGFAVTGKDISTRRTVSLEYPIGMERVMREAVRLFQEEGLKPTLRLDGRLSLGRRGQKRGIYTNADDPTPFYDHRNDSGWWIDKAYIGRKHEVMRDTFEKYKDLATTYGGPAVTETFGEERFDPVNREENYSYTPLQEDLLLNDQVASGQITAEYIREEGRSFTIISYPIPEIGPHFEEIFKETVKLNTLDSSLYRRIQDLLIKALDRGEAVHIEGAGKNHTDLTVALHPLKDPEKETRFENCVADVNIPVGEVFTSPKLEGTSGTLYVSKVYLNGFEYRDLSLTFKEGMIESITCSNFMTPEENRAYIDDHILFHHKTLPMGEFAIGTNTTAYRMGEDFGIGDRLPILIREKTGPHFAVGDTCYSRAEDIPMKNPDGKECIARSNSLVDRFRKTEPDKAYFNCHTDITIPYEEIGRITVLLSDGGGVDLIRDGRFCLPGTEELNIPLDRDR